MGYLSGMDEKIRKMTVVDMALVKWSALFGGIIIAKLFPQLLKIGYPVLIVLMIACGAKPFYKCWIKK